MSESYNSILYENKDGVAQIIINRPEARNSLNEEVTLEVYDAASRAARDSSIRVLVLRGKGADFCCGADVKQYNAGDNAPRTRKEKGDSTFYRTSVLLHEMDAVTVAAIRGGCAGAGFGWACACDMRVADTKTRFNTAFLDVGVAGDMGVPWFLPRIIGAGHARDLSFFPRKVSGEEARALGLVNRLFAEDEFENELEALLKRLAGAAPLALKALKSNYVEAERTGLSTYIGWESERHQALFKTKDREEAFAAFVEKRAPRFEGR
ncbi:enoyl-CoA hydratase/isomerase family protein [Tepidicaulis sp. LMO-SS28]|uniref:enoyl-CoA hydratase/isomerase family protein n=1 Tax=Tepidicaulis sp. LMO-SS28 TaxID=3447455 RepID=UPI003EE2951A